MKNWYGEEICVEEEDNRSIFERWSDDTGDYILKYPWVSGCAICSIIIYFSLLIAGIFKGRKGFELGWVPKK